jgi:hypothetical protein
MATTGSFSRRAFWVFGVLSAAFLIAAFFFKTKESADHQIIRVMGSVFCGLLGSCIAGGVAVRLNTAISKAGTLSIQATSGAALFVIVLLNWPASKIPIPPGATAEEIQILREGIQGVEASLQKLTDALESRNKSEDQLRALYIDLKKRVEVFERNKVSEKLTLPDRTRFASATRLLEAQVLAGLEAEAARLASLLVAEAGRRGISVRVTSGRRVLKAGGDGTSIHITGHAFDIGVVDSRGNVITNSPLLQTVGPIGIRLGLIWGGDWNSKKVDHFQTKRADTIFKSLKQ